MKTQNLLNDIFKMLLFEQEINPCVNISPKNKRLLFTNFNTQDKAISQPRPVTSVQPVQEQRQVNYRQNYPEMELPAPPPIQQPVQSVDFTGPQQGKLLLIIEKNMFQNSYNKISNEKEALLDAIITKGLQYNKAEIGIIKMPTVPKSKDEVLNIVQQFNPKAILLFGPNPLGYLLNERDINLNIGKEFRINNIPTIVVHALNTLVRNAQNEKRATWEAIKKVLSIVG